ncbi:uncharacterized protein LOC110463935 isoform X2 [Mizuhopecten yessoensis]|uniref:Uncharacterized protein n=1 Tax=Mizuhopecten yessoensis TaxID=6573 RepID=A0A210PV40_MIZYE|nr:uncharacterized protein LOC110463935 isoform X2 [Mizuhopecten yessoensis]OWF40360.1 hypothetical protein KP79_PYT05509 [Mizuhopecten yessoensis]
MNTVSDGISCFGATCQAGEEFCDHLSRFCISCSATAWKKLCFTSDHIYNCTDYCRALELKNRPPNQPEAYQMPPLLIAVIAVSLLVTIGIGVLVGALFRKYLIRIKPLLPCFVDQNGTNETIPENTDNHDDEAEVVLLETPIDPHPVQVTEEEATEHKSKDYPKFGPTALKNHEEAKLM